MNADAGLAANTALLEEMVRILDEIADDLVFVGGCATGLLVTSVSAQAVRITTDVDVVAEVTTLHQYHALEKRIAAKGFRPDPEVICRWRMAGLQLRDAIGDRCAWLHKPLVPTRDRDGGTLHAAERGYDPSRCEPTFPGHQV